MANKNFTTLFSESWISLIYRQNNKPSCGQVGTFLAKGI